MRIKRKEGSRIRRRRMATGRGGEVEDDDRGIDRTSAGCC